MDAPTEPTSDASAAESAVSAAPTTGPAIAVEHLSHRYPPVKARRRNSRGQVETAPASADSDRPALSDVSFTVSPGEVFGILGPNGGGKTTLFRILSTLMRPSATPASGGGEGGGGNGSLAVFGHDVLTAQQAVRAAIGVVFQSPSLDGKLTARENMLHQGRLYGLSAGLPQRVDELLGYFGLSDRAEEPVERFSGGMRRRVELAKALLHRPRLLLLDEPSTGLDPGARADLWAQLLKLRDEQGVTVALTTHLMEEADRCDRLAILSQGEVAAIDTPSNLKATIGGDVVTLQLKDSSEPETRDAIKTVTDKWGPFEDGAITATEEGIRFEHTDGAGLVAEVAEVFAGKLRRISVGQPTLEDVFLHLTGHTLWEGQ